MPFGRTVKIITVSSACSVKKKMQTKPVVVKMKLFTFSVREKDMNKCFASVCDGMDNFQ